MEFLVHNKIPENTYVEFLLQVCSLVWLPNSKEFVTGQGHPWNKMSLWKYSVLSKASEFCGKHVENHTGLCNDTFVQCLCHLLSEHILSLVVAIPFVVVFLQRVQ